MCDGLKTGDTLACWGKSGISGWISRLTPRLRFWMRAPSHVAVIVVQDGEPIVYESTTQTAIADAFTGRIHKGIQAHRFADWLDAYGGRVELLRLKVPMRPASEERAAIYARDCHATQIAYDLRGAIHSGTPIRNTEDGTELFCSEFLGFLLRHGGTIGTQVNCSELTPWDIYHLPCFHPPERLKS